MATDKKSKIKSEYVMGQCPKCKSLDVTYGKESSKMTYSYFQGNVTNADVSSKKSTF